VNIRQKVVILVLLAIAFVLVGMRIHAATVTMKCTYYSDGCVRCTHYNSDGKVIGKTAIDCR
jgi:nitrate/TMAO reductase-like tetraheme cytochrome c subunit